MNHMRARMPIATGTWYHVMSRDITHMSRSKCPQNVPAPASATGDGLRTL